MLLFSEAAVKTKSELLEILQTRESGLTEKESAARFIRFGSNELHLAQIRWWQILLRQFRSPFVYLLIAAGALAGVLGEGIDAAMISLFVLINATLGFYQEFRSEHSLRLLQQFVRPRARVVRENQEVAVESRFLVPGDVVVVEPGDILPCDLRFVSAENLTLDESVLTGESVSVPKIASEQGQPASQMHEAVNLGFSGTAVATGRGVGVAFATGMKTQLGEISRLTAQSVRVSAFEKGIARFSRFILRLTLVTLVFVFLANLLVKGDRLNVFELVLFSIALAVSVIPEALPVVTTFSLSRGALKLAKNRVVVKRLSAIEDLGGIEVLCTDKTGTLTENKLRVKEVNSSAPREFLLAASMAAASSRSGVGFTEPFDEAIWEELSESERGQRSKIKLLDEIPFDPKCRRNGVVVASNNRSVLIVRGAPEAILPLCSKTKVTHRRDIDNWASGQGRQGFRVILVARKFLPRGINRFQPAQENALSLLGGLSFIDPIKATTSSAIQRAGKLGVAVKILTGDSPEVAGFVATQVGLIKSPDEVMTGDQFESLPAVEQLAAVLTRSAFARVSPQQKYQIIKLLQAKREVGFLGEGINDAPALKIANVGLVVAGASDIAREAADIVLLKKSLNVIVDGIKDGREVFANTTKYIKATLASNFGNFYAVALGSLVVEFLPMLPLQLLLVNLLSDFPMIAIATDRVERDDLKKPKSYNIKEIALLATLLGVVSTVFDFVFFGLFYRMGPAVLQTNWFIASIITELVFVFSIRTRFFALQARRPSGTLLGLSVVAAMATVILPFTSLGHEMFRFISPALGHLGLIFGLVGLYFLVSELVKLLYYHFWEHG
ncbi:MAG: HAD-IC family P-type ATPase [Candidatus Doudnabacteria bacterium]|nr:HAD-IC family P-type ATPase [Candidatus Doudnabacteria bacterium]